MRREAEVRQFDWQGLDDHVTGLPIAVRAAVGECVPAQRMQGQLASLYRNKSLLASCFHDSWGGA